ncbi:MAG: hypothetical protein FWG30_05210 [Eubacteriaceae bacterium]|jgi:superoxide reductase|nr:hypothetical protein [Eubacteriaceae bacterium]
MATILKCEKCGKILDTIKDSMCDTMCCGQAMSKLVPNTEDASHEKHVPAVIRRANQVRIDVGAEEHPMTPEHFIEWIEIVQSGKVQRVELNAQCSPMATFTFDSVEPIEVYAYCNLHGLWKTDYDIMAIADEEDD